MGKSHPGTEASSPPTKCLPLVFKTLTSCSSLAQKPPQSHWNNVWTLPSCGVCHRCPSCCPTTLASLRHPPLHCCRHTARALPRSLCPLPPFPIRPVPGTVGLGGRPWNQRSQEHGRALFPVLPWHGLSPVRVPLLLAPRLVGCFVLLGGSNPCVPVSGYITHVPCAWFLACVSSGIVVSVRRGGAGAEWCLLQTWTSVPRPCTTAAPARTATTCPAPTSAPALTATARLGLNVWVSPERPCQFLLCAPGLALTLAPDPHPGPPPGFPPGPCHLRHQTWHSTGVCVSCLIWPSPAHTDKPMGGEALTPSQLESHLTSASALCPPSQT